MITLKHKTAAILLIVFLGVYFQFKHIKDFPEHIHAWAQSDRYAIALGFVNNDLNFFKPETFVYNHQFPDNFLDPAEQTITSIDFPIHDYCVAVFMKISGSKSPWVFRIYILLYSFIGLFYLFKLTYLFTENPYKCILAILFAASSPVFVFYQSGFLPTIPSLANALIGIYCYSYYRKFERRNLKYFRWAFVFLTLAALSRLTFAIPLIAIAGIEMLSSIKQRKIQFGNILPIAISFVALGGYFLYNRYLTHVYGSLFLNHLLPPKDFTQGIQILKEIKKNWLFDYFTGYHYLGFGLILLLSIKGFAKTLKWNRIPLLLMISGVITLGAISFFVLMMKQFVSHDYYFLDTFYLPFILFLILFLSNIQLDKKVYRFSAILLCVILLFFIFNNLLESQAKRYDVGSWNRVATTVRNYEGSESFLRSKNIPENAKLLVVGHFGPNIPFIKMNRKGYLIKNATPYHFNRSKKWGIDYYIFENEFFATEEYLANPSLINQLEVKFTNGKIMLCKLLPEPKNQTLLSFLGFSNKKAKHEFGNNFENNNQKYWTVDSIISLNNEAKNDVAFIDSSMEYGLSYKRKNLAILKSKACSVVISSLVNFEKLDNCELVVALIDNGEVTSYQTRNLVEIVKNENKWQHVDLVFNLPRVKGENVEFSVFVSNGGKSKVKLDDFVIKVY